MAQSFFLITSCLVHWRLSSAISAFHPPPAPPQDSSCINPDIASYLQEPYVSFSYPFPEMYQQLSLQLVWELFIQSCLLLIIFYLVSMSKSNAREAQRPLAVILRQLGRRVQSTGSVELVRPAGTGHFPLAVLEWVIWCQG